MIRNIFALCLCLVALSAAAQEPTLADGTVSVLSPKPLVKESASTPCADGKCEVAREVRLAPWQARNLYRQAERQNYRDCRNGNCRTHVGPTAIVVQPGRKCKNCN